MIVLKPGRAFLEPELARLREITRLPLQASSLLTARSTYL
jgi:hypothetical protein